MCNVKFMTPGTVIIKLNAIDKAGIEKPQIS